MLEELRSAVLAANRALPAQGLVKLTWGNASGFDAERELVVIKPSGVPYADLDAESLVIVDLLGNVVEGALRPSSDTPTHVVLYRAFPELGGIVHTHSTYATAFAQAGRDIPVLGTTHADFAPQPVPLTRHLARSEIVERYEASTGDALVEVVRRSGLAETPAALVPGHGPFCWADTPAAALDAAVTLEEVAKIAAFTLLLAPGASALEELIRQKHFSRKHGKNAYYGQTATSIAP